jgi:protoporphyrin/coproporphyrin ferrochelatase
MAEKIAIVLANLGGPDQPSAVQPFLFNLFNDPAIIGLPAIIRTPLAHLISRKRAKIAAGIYEKLGGKSPLLDNTKAQAAALEQALAAKGITARCFIAMRYWHPFSAAAAADMKAYGPDKILFLPLYPQFSTTTTGSSLKDWQKAMKKQKLTQPVLQTCCYPTEPGFIAAMADHVREKYQQALAFGTPRLLLSAHGLPEKIIKAGDPYQKQCEATARALVEALNIPGLDWINCYQSRVGPLQWIGPSTDAEIHRAGADEVPVVIAPIAFVSEHSETLVEIEEEYREMAHHCGVPFFARVDTVGTHPAFIGGLANLVQARLAFGPKICRALTEGKCG